MATLLFSENEVNINNLKEQIKEQAVMFVQGLLAVFGGNIGDTTLTPVKDLSVNFNYTDARNKEVYGIVINCGGLEIIFDGTWLKINNSMIDDVSVKYLVSLVNDHSEPAVIAFKDSSEKINSLLQTLRDLVTRQSVLLSVRDGILAMSIKGDLNER